MKYEVLTAVFMKGFVFRDITAYYGLYYRKREPFKKAIVPSPEYFLQ
jgi:hypothetical protein